MIDLRSDTVTKPTDLMRKTMAESVVGDDVYREDPTVKKLEELASNIFKKEAALFVASGTMGNLIALLTHTRPGDEIILEAESHIYYYEVGGLGRLGGLIPQLIPGKDGIFSIEQLKKALRPDDIHFPKATLLCLENTHNRAGGRVLDQEKVKEVVSFAKQQGLRTHLDGARIFNAAVASNTDVSTLCEPFDSVMFCLSKGLAAPIGSVLVGNQDFIDRARKYRKMLGGGMRQAGVIAAAGLVALEVMTKRLGEDHRNAQLLATKLDEIDGFQVVNHVETNIIVLELTNNDFTVQDLLTGWRQNGILASSVSEKRIRLVTHYQVSDSDIEKVIRVTKELILQARR